MGTPFSPIGARFIRKNSAASSGWSSRNFSARLSSSSSLNSGLKPFEDAELRRQLCVIFGIGWGFNAWYRCGIGDPGKDATCPSSTRFSIRGLSFGIRRSNTTEVNTLAPAMVTIKAVRADM
jgi:hypothetical protein